MFTTPTKIWITSRVRKDGKLTDIVEEYGKEHIQHVFMRSDMAFRGGRKKGF